MRRAAFLFALLVGVVLAAAPRTRAQQVIDRIVVRIEDDILFLSEVRELGRYQELVEGHAASEDKLLAQLIDQWIVNHEAAAARFGHPAEADVRAEVDALVKEFPSPEAYQVRLDKLGLNQTTVQRLIERQLYLARYLDYKFRPAAQIEAAAVEKYYREELLPELARRGRPAPRLENVQDRIRELLTQREISVRAARWLDETRGRLRIEITLSRPGGGAAGEKR